MFLAPPLEDGWISQFAKRSDGSDVDQRWCKFALWLHHRVPPHPRPHGRGGGACNIRGWVDGKLSRGCISSCITLFKRCAPLYRGLSGNHSEIPRHHRLSMSHSQLSPKPVQSLFRFRSRSGIKMTGLQTEVILCQYSGIALIL